MYLSDVESVYDEDRGPVQSGEFFGETDPIVLSLSSVFFLFAVIVLFTNASTVVYFPDYSWHVVVMRAILIVVVYHFGLRFLKIK